jgi:hypothetical protein
VKFKLVSAEKAELGEVSSIATGHNLRSNAGAPREGLMPLMQATGPPSVGGEESSLKSHCAS